uniref:SURP motif domain-containing protein n=1 Tax=Glossina austeni TaxID=7395 RepID=A0A1A9UIC0_GLOAU
MPTDNDYMQKLLLQQQEQPTRMKTIAESQADSLKAAEQPPVPAFHKFYKQNQRFLFETNNAKSTFFKAAPFERLLKFKEEIERLVIQEEERQRQENYEENQSESIERDEDQLESAIRRIERRNKDNDLKNSSSFGSKS